MSQSETDSIIRSIADAMASRPATATAASLDLAKLIAPSVTFRTIFDHLEENEHRNAKFFASAESPLLRAVRELATLPRMGDAFAASLAFRSEALAGIGETMHKLMEGIQFRVPEIGASVAAMMARTSAVEKEMAAWRFPTIDLNPVMMDAVTKGLAAPRFMEGLRRASVAFDFPQLSAGFHQFLHESKFAHETLTESLVAIPPRELFLSGDASLALELVESPDSEIEAEREVVRGEIDAFTRPTLEIVLTDFDERLVELWRGAREAAEARRSDCARHVLTSLRELYSQVLHRLAPDDAVRAWSTAASDFTNDRPTRPARLRFALRHVQSPSLTKFLELDQKGVAELVNLFNHGTHGVDPAVSPRELPFIVRRVEGFLCALVEAHQIGDEMA